MRFDMIRSSAGYFMGLTFRPRLWQLAALRVKSPSGKAPSFGGLTCFLRASISHWDEVKNLVGLGHGLIEWVAEAEVKRQRAFVAALVREVQVNPVRLRGSRVYEPARTVIAWR